MSTPGKAFSSQPPKACLARQPILTKDERVFGYELLFRETPDDRRFSADGDSATSNTIDTLNVMGLDVVCDGQMGFINCTQQMLLKEIVLLLPPGKVAVELEEQVVPDQSVIAACDRLRQRNYKVALDNFVPNDPRTALVPHVDFIKVDIRRVSPEQGAALAAKCASKDRLLIAHKVETRDQFLTAGKSGFSLFQGYFFHHPERMRARHIPANQASQLRLLKAVSTPHVDLAAVEDLIKHDASLCYRLLRYLNSPLLGLTSQVQSVRHAMNMLGELELVRWVRMATTLIMGQERCSDLVLSSLVRARFCELIGPKVPHGSSDLFLLGMFSLMDAILEIPMGVVVEGLAFDAQTKAALLAEKTGTTTPLSPIYHLMVARETGDWERVTTEAKKLQLSLPFVNRAYNEAMAWAREMTVGAGGSEAK